MRTYALHRVMAAIPTLLLVTFLLFAAIRFVPGDVVDAIYSDAGYTPQQAQALREELGLDGPVWKQYAAWLGQVAQGDLGSSIQDKKPVTDLLATRIQVTLELTVLALVLSGLIGITLGTIAAIRQDSWLDYLLRTISIGGLSIPGFWLATIVLVVGQRSFNWSPALDYTRLWDDPGANLEQFIVPAFLMALGTSAQLMRMTRGMLLEVLRQDYVRTARAKGVAEWTVIIRHTLRNAMLPVVTQLGLAATTLVGGTVIFESVFVLPGMGRLVLDAVGRRDYPVIQAINLILATTVIAINLLVDLSYGMLDPRIRQAGS